MLIKCMYLVCVYWVIKRIDILNIVNVASLEYNMYGYECERQAAVFKTVR